VNLTGELAGGGEPGFLTLGRAVRTMRVLKLAEKVDGGAVHMDKKRLDYYRKKLQAKREELLRSIARTEEEGRSADDDPTVDLADKAANSYTKEFLFGQNNTDRTTLQQIDEALERIRNSTFGTCLHCETELQQKRLEAVPWASHCTTCQEKHEQGLL
jgi:DnaK suppressor protein